MTEEELNKKWEEFKKRVRLFNHIPFVGFVLAAGSMAMGKARDESDFDVIVGVKSGRIFTARFLSVIFFTLRGWRRKNHTKQDKSDAKNKICLNHFVTKESYRLSPPYNDYWNRLYQCLVPLTGDKEKIAEFFSENCVWMKGCVDPDFARHREIGKSATRSLLEFVLMGKLGDFMEEILRGIQKKRIEKSLNDPSHYKPRVIFSDNELEFHPDTRRIEEMMR